MVLKSGMIAAAIMGDPNASIPNPQPEYYRPMFGAFGRSMTESSVTFVSQALLQKAQATWTCKETSSGLQHAQHRQAVNDFE